MKLWQKYKEPVLYLFFGGCTTLVNILAYAAGTRIFHMDVMIGTVAAWFISVVFAYVTNRNYVFQSTNTGMKAVMVEISAFTGCRLLTGAADFGIMYLFVTVLKYNDLVIKVLSNLIVIVSNYAASRLLIFKKMK